MIYENNHKNRKCQEYFQVTLSGKWVRTVGSNFSSHTGQNPPKLASNNLHHCKILVEPWNMIHDNNHPKGELRKEVRVILSGKRTRTES